MSEDDRSPMAGGGARSSEPETFALRQLQVAMSEAQQALGRRLRMFPTDLAAMSHLAASPGAMGPTDLAGRLGLSPGATTELVDRLERAGHLVRERDLADRRRVRLTASESARVEVMDRLGALIDGLDELAEEFDDDERAVVRRYLERAIAVYRSYAEDEAG
ncbi:MAG TPA: MarR family transcriptional regulator [Amnibacterium sp.]|uniref:MarR family winged helix-turn-helix transcriptional regulator n=1 Tax=Amnibacterium sp. TaxID=1872496 RepID=UPI002F944F8A